MTDANPNGSPINSPQGYPGAPTPPPPPSHAAPPYPSSDPGTPQGGAYAQPAYPQPYGYGSNPYGYAPAQRTNALAIVSLVSAIAAFVIVPFIGSVVAVITGHMSLRQLKTNGEGGRGLALAGTIVGWVGVGLAVIGAIAFFLWLSFVIGAVESSNYDYS